MDIGGRSVSIGIVLNLNVAVKYSVIEYKHRRTLRYQDGPIIDSISINRYKPARLLDLDVSVVDPISFYSY